MVPKFEPDPSWPHLPDKWVWGQVSSVSIDQQGHAWILQRPTTVRNDQKGKAAPPVLEFDEAGNFIQGWGGAGDGYDWPETNHGITVDYKGNVWIGGNGRNAPGAAAAPGRGAGTGAGGGAGRAGATVDESAPARGANSPFHDNMILKFTQSGKFLMQIGKPSASKGRRSKKNATGPTPLAASLAPSARNLRRRRPRV